MSECWLQFRSRNSVTVRSEVEVLRDCSADKDPLATMT